MSLKYKFILGSISTVSLGSVGFYFYLIKQHNQFIENWNHNPQKKLQLFKTQNTMVFDYDDNMNRYEKEHQIDYLRKKLLQNAEGYILETCVGTARNIQYFPSGSEVLAVDWNQSYIEAALRKPVQNNIKINYKIEDVEKMTLKSNLFDCVVDTFGLNYVLYPEKCLKEMSRVCKPKGKIFLLESGQGHYDWENFFLNLSLPQYIHEYGYFNNRNWDEIIHNSGLKIIYKERQKNGSLYTFILENN